MLLTVTRSACSAGLAHALLTISNINEPVLAVNSQHVACKLKGNCTGAAPPNLLLSSFQSAPGERWSHLLGSHLQRASRFAQKWAKCSRSRETGYTAKGNTHTHRSCCHHSKCDRFKFICNFTVRFGKKNFIYPEGNCKEMAAKTIRIQQERNWTGKIHSS